MHCSENQRFKSKCCQANKDVPEDVVNDYAPPCGISNTCVAVSQKSLGCVKVGLPLLDQFWLIITNTALGRAIR